MTILQALDRYYHRLDGVAEPGRSPEKFGWCIVLDRDGNVIDVEDLRDLSGKKPRPKLHMVPAAVKRTVGIAPNFLWDKTAYVLGRTAGEGKRTAQEHAVFLALHLGRLAGQEDDGLVALRLFLENWTPDRFDTIAGFRPEMLDANVMFRLDGERGYLHDRPAARALADVKPEVASNASGPLCLITGESGPIARLHPTIKGVEGAQSSGAALVSFNLDAFTSLGKNQGENAPTSEVAAFRYGTALNHLLTRDGPNRVRRPIGDATVVYWADASNAEPAEQLFGEWLADDITDETEAEKIRQQMEAVARGRPIAELRADIEPGTQFHVLGLSPNAARISVRFWLSDSLDHFAKLLAEHHDDLKIAPLPRDWGKPSVNRLLARTTALQEKFENIPPLLAGEVMRAILTGRPYPQSLLAAAIIRLRAGDDPLSGWHVAVIRAVLHRDYRFKPNKKEDVPVSLAPDEPNKAYQLGRLFAVLETAQRMALGRINATIRDRYFGAASATPASVFPLLLRGAQNHLGKLRKTGKGGWIEREIEDILDRLSLDLPRALPLAEQGRFAVGYYHQRKDQFKARPEAEKELAEAENDPEGDAK